MNVRRSRRQPHISVEVGLDVGLSRRGKPNQDAVGLYSDYCRDWDCLDAKGLLFVLADGMGGASGGEVASRVAIDIVCTSYYSDPDREVVPSLERALQAANTHIQELGQTDPGLYGLGTTLVAAVIHGDDLVVASVGDSRAYQLRQGELILLTLDHTVVQEKVRQGVLSAEEAATHPRRHELSRNLGALPTAEPDFVTNPLLEGDVLLLCSDGLWGAVGDDEMEQLLEASKGEPTAQMLVDLANQRGGPDNISLILICFAGLETAITEPLIDQLTLLPGDGDTLVLPAGEPEKREATLDAEAPVTLPAARPAESPISSNTAAEAVLPRELVDSPARRWQVGGGIGAFLLLLAVLVYSNMFPTVNTGGATGSLTLNLDESRPTANVVRDLLVAATTRATPAGSIPPVALPVLLDISPILATPTRTPTEEGRGVPERLITGPSNTPTTGDEKGQAGVIPPNAGGPGVAPTYHVPEERP